jgi:phosphoglycolate phosphatase-like HAD superfamily hydrolase
MKHKKAFIFDWDGTLFDSMKHKRDHFVELFSKWEKDPQKLETFHRTYSGIPRKELFKKAFWECTGEELGDTEYQELSDEYTLLNVSKGKNSPLFADVIPFLEKEKEQLLFISSSSAPQELESMVSEKGIQSYFKEVLGSRPGFSKGPEHVSLILDRYQLSKEDVFFLGDDQKDLELAAKAGVEAKRIDRETKKEGFLQSLGELI